MFRSGGASGVTRVFSFDDVVFGGGVAGGAVGVDVLAVSARCGTGLALKFTDRSELFWLTLIQAVVSKGFVLTFWTVLTTLVSTRFFALTIHSE
ncbi:MAG: hypothetical protein QF704_05625 [Anaerolineales bacterium]|nr:hypothetical protein [Anaerolineales bacterium]MDP6770156.1 hypothetical protein [Anaerolineales bacterium]